MMPSINPTKAPTVVAIKAPAFMITTPVNRNRYLKLLIYGQYGSGKTTLAASAVDVPELKDVLFVDAESGDMAIEDSPRIKGFADISRIRITNFMQVGHVQEFLKAHCRYRDNKDMESLKRLESMFTGVPVDEIETPKIYRTVIIDSLTEVDQYSMYSLLNITADTKIVDNDLDVAQFAEYRKNNQMMQLLSRAYRDLPMNVIMVCSSFYTQDELKKFHYGPKLTGQLSGQIQGFVDIVGFLMVAKMTEGAPDARRRLYVQPIGNFDAKNRKAAFKGAFFDDPTMGSIMEALKPKQ